MRVYTSHHACALCMVNIELEQELIDSDLGVSSGSSMGALSCTLTRTISVAGETRALQKKREREVK